MSDGTESKQAEDTLNVVIRVKRSCVNCAKEFTTKQSLSRHKRNCGGRSSYTSCARCQKQFARLDSLKRHMISCNKAKPKVKVCDQCFKEFRNNWFLRRHLPCKGNLVCAKCNRSFRKLERYERHNEKCSGVREVITENGRVAFGEEITRELVGDTVVTRDGSSLPPNTFVAMGKGKREENLPLPKTMPTVVDTFGKGDEIFGIDRDTEDLSLCDVYNETKVYILDDDMPFTDEDEEDTPVFPDNARSVDYTTPGIGKNNDFVKPEYRETTKSRNSRLASQIANEVRNTFKEEKILDRITQLDIMRQAMREVGLHDVDDYR